MDIGIVRGLFTAMILALFVGIWLWSWSRKRTTDFEAASQLPLGDDAAPPAKRTTPPTGRGDSTNKWEQQS